MDNSTNVSNLQSNTILDYHQIAAGKNSYEGVQKYIAFHDK